MLSAEVVWGILSCQCPCFQTIIFSVWYGPFPFNRYAGWRDLKKKKKEHKNVPLLFLSFQERSSEIIFLRWSQHKKWQLFLIIFIHHSRYCQSHQGVVSYRHLVIFFTCVQASFWGCYRKLGVSNCILWYSAFIQTVGTTVSPSLSLPTGHTCPVITHFEKCKWFTSTLEIITHTYKVLCIQHLTLTWHTS